MDTITPLSEQWQTALEGFAQAQLDAGYAAETVRSRQARLTVLARQTALNPSSLTVTETKHWLRLIDNSDVTPASKKAQRVAIRAFARWILGTGRTADSLPVVTFPSRRVYSTDQRWLDALDLYDTAMHAAQLAPSTIELRRKHLNRFAVDATLPPWDVSYEDLRGWLDRLGAMCSRGTVLAHRVSLRAFYLWAHRGGRILIDPAAEPSHRATELPTPPEWTPELRAYRSYLRAIGRPEPTITGRMSQLRRFAREHASLSPWAVTLDDLIDWMASKRWAAETRRSHRSSLRSFYAWAVQTDRIAASPAHNIPVIRATPPRPRPALESEYAAALTKSDPRERLALRLSAELGLRRTEVVTIHSRDLTGSSDGWSLTVHGKGNKERMLPMPANLASSLHALPAGYAFPGQFDGHLSPKWMGKLISELLPEGVTMHALRHRFATRAYNVDRDVFTVQRLLGHASPATTQRYVQVADTAMRRLVDAVSA